MANDLELKVIIGAKADQLKAALADLAQALNTVSAQAGQAGAQTASAFAPAEAQLGKTRAGVESVSDQLSRAKTQLIGFFSVQYGVALAKDIIQTADAFSSMNARLKLATQSSEEYATAQSALFGIAQRTATSLESNIVLYARLADSMRDMGRSQQDALAFTELTGQAMRISGASAETAKAGITQLSQAMASGVLRGDEFNSVMENSPRLARAMADGLNIPIGKLREMAEAGQLTADKVTGALLSQADTLAAEYEKIPLTVGAAMTQLSTAWTQYLGEADQAEGATKSLALAISDISANFTAYANTILTVGRDALVIWAGFKTIQLGAAVAQFFGLTAAAKASAAAMAETVAANKQAEAAATALATANRAAAAQAVARAQAHRIVAAAAMAEAEATLAAMTAAAFYGPARAAAERVVTASRTELAAATAALAAAETASAAAMATSRAAAIAAAPAVTRLAVATGLLTKSLGPLMLAFLAFEALKVAGKWLGEFAGELVHGKIKADEFGQAMADAGPAALELKRDTEALAAAIEQSNRIAAFDHVGESAEAAQKRLRAAADAILKSFSDVAEKSGDVGKALAAAFGTADIKSGDGIDAYMLALDDLAAKGAATGAQIKKSLEDGFGKLDLSGLQAAQFAIQSSHLEADKLASMLDVTLGAALKKLGTDAQAVNDGLSKGFRDTAQAFAIVVDNAQASAEAIKFAFDKLIDGARTKAEIDLLKVEFLALAETGKLSADEVGDAWLRLEDKLRLTAGQIDGALGDSFTRLGVKSAEAMKGAFDQMAVDFERVKQSGQASAEGIDVAYQKMKSAVVASVNAMTAATRDALQATKDHTAAMQAGLDATKARGAATVAAANAQKADAEYAQASAEAMRSGTDAARAKADALGLAAQAAHAAAVAAEADAVASRKAAEAAQAEVAAKQALAAAAANPSEATRQAAVAAQNYANETARGAEEARQAATAAHKTAAETASAAGAAQALASSFGDAARSADVAANSIANMSGTVVAALDGDSYEALIKKSYDAAKAAISDTKSEIDRLIERAGDGMGLIVAFGDRGTAAYLDATRRAREYGAELARIQAAIERNEAATRSWESAMDSLTRASASLKDELDRALGNDKAIEERAYADKKRALEEQYQAAMDAARDMDDSARRQAEGKARAEYQDALAALKQLHRINLDQIAESAAEKAAADKQNHLDEMARIAAENNARSEAAALLQKVGSQSYSADVATAAASSGGTVSASYGGAQPTYNQVLNITTAGGLSEETIRREIAPVLNRMMTGSR